MRLALAACVALFLLLFGCAEGYLVPREQSVMSEVQKCQLKCSMMARSGADMSPGPCVGKVSDDWVCDVAHSPRIPADDLPQNQCAECLNGSAHHFVEVTPECQPIRYA